MKIRLRCYLLLLFACDNFALADPQTANPPALKIDELTAQIAKGDNGARFTLGRAYLRGEGVAQNYAQALQLLKPAAEAAHAEAMGAYGFMLSRGLGISKNEAESQTWLKKAADLGVVNAQLNLGIMTLKGMGAPADAKVGMELIEKAANAGSADAMVRLAEARHFGETGVAKDPAKAALWAEKGAQAGNAQAQNLMGTMREHGLGVERDYKAAAEWYRKAATQHHVKAQANLGRLLSNGRGVAVDRVEAYYWLRVSAAQGEVTSQNFLTDFKQSLSTAELAEAERRVTDYQRERFHAKRLAKPVGATAQ